MGAIGKPSAAGARPIPADKGWSGHIDALAFHAATTPNKHCYADLASGAHLTYREFDRLVARATNWMIGELPEGSRLAMLTRNCIEMMVVSEASLRAGVVFVPVNWRMAPAEVVQILTDCRPEAVIYDADFADALTGIPPSSQSRLAIRRDAGGQVFRELIDGSSAETARRSFSGPAMLLYTSGTTGKPKGVMLTAENLFFGAINFCQSFSVSRESLLRCDMPLFHIAALGVAKAAFLAGACVVIADRFNPEEAVRQLGDPTSGITHYFGVPRIAATMLKAVEQVQGDYSNWQYFAVGGAPLSGELVQAFAKRGIVITNTYGITEATGTVTAMPANAGLIARNPVACGLCTLAMEMRLVTPEGDDVAPGQVGEIWVRGPAVSPGYWGQWPRASGDWFKTGDAALLNSQGLYEIVDRWKDMYISGGENVYPAEVEIVLQNHSAVEEAAVIGVPNAKWGETGCAFVVPNSDLAPDVETIRAWCLEKLAKFKCPSLILIVDEIPKTPSGKAKKNVLRERYITSIDKDENTMTI